MKNSILILSFALITHQSFCMSPHKGREIGPARVRIIIEDLRESGAIDLTKQQITFQLANVVLKELPDFPLRQSLDGALSYGDLEQRRKDAILELLKTRKDDLLREAADNSGAGAGEPTNNQ